MRPYQRDCIVAVESAIAGGKRDLMVAMATGTGKTLLTVAQIYRLLDSKLVRRILFLVDRKALAAHAVREFNAFNTPKGNKFTREYEVYSQRFQREEFGDEESFDPKVLPNDYNLEVTWLKDDSLEDSDDLPEPQDLAAEAITELEAVVDDLREIVALVEKEEAVEA